MVCPTALSSLPTDPARQLDVLGHDGHTLGVDGTQVGVLKQSNQVGLTGFLKGERTSINVEVLGRAVSDVCPTCRAPMAALWNLRSVLKSCAISLTSL